VAPKSIIDTKSAEIEEELLLGSTNSDSENWHKVSYVSKAECYSWLRHRTVYQTNNNVSGDLLPPSSVFKWLQT